MRLRTSFFGRHLHHQVVVPLVLAAVVVGIAATILAVFLLSNLTDAWVEDTAAAASDSLAAELAEQAHQLIGVTKYVSEDPRMKRALGSGDPGAVGGVLAGMNVALAADNLMLLDSGGRIVASTGRLGFLPNEEALTLEQRDYTSLMMSHAVFLELDGRLTLTALQPIAMPDGGVYMLAMSELVDDEFLQFMAAGSDFAHCIYTPKGRRIAFAPGDGRVMGGADAGEELSALDELVGEMGAVGARTTRLGSGKSRYAVHVKRASLGDHDPTGSVVRIASLVSTDITSRTRTTTTALILMWSVFAVFVLVGLGNWVARRISTPLASLSAVAQRISEGDFGVKVPVEGGNELAELGESFNRMTDSLRERTESLTKKVLELATLYEMSRSLGSTFELEQLLESVLDSAMRIFGADSGYVTLRDKDTSLYRLLAARGMTGRLPEKGLRSSMSEWVVREGRPLIFNPSDEDGHEVDTVTGSSAALCVPMTTSEGVIGTITIGSHDSQVRFSGEDVRLLSTIANHVSIAVGNIELFISLQDAYLATVRSLAEAVDAKDPYTRGHSDKVAQIGVKLGERMGLSADQRIALEMAAYLHDIGKIGIREEILLKPGSLTDSEMGQMRHHPLIGANILKPVAFPWPIAPVVRHHHERWDGRGYPAGLKGEEIPLLARILAVADSYEAMTSDRPYRKGRSRDEAIEELRRCAGTQFDAQVVHALVEVLEEEGEEAERGWQAVTEDVEPEEMSATVVALCDNIFTEFRRLGGPRLASNIEKRLNELCSEKGLSCGVQDGRLSLRGDEDGSRDPRSLMEVLDALMVLIEHTSGHALAEHFYTQALDDLSVRMRGVAEAMRLRATA